MLFLHVYNNSQRPSAVLNMTIDKYEKQSEQNNKDNKTYITIKVGIIHWIAQQIIYSVTKHIMQVKYYKYIFLVLI